MLQDDSRIQLICTPAASRSNSAGRNRTQITSATPAPFPWTSRRGCTRGCVLDRLILLRESGGDGQVRAIAFRKDPSGIRDQHACEGIGASVWWPNKDQWRDEVESMRSACRFRTAWWTSPTESSWARRTWAWLHTVGLAGAVPKLTITTVSLKHRQLEHLADRLGSCRWTFMPARTPPTGEDTIRAGCGDDRGVPALLASTPSRKTANKLIEAPYSGMEHQTAVTYGTIFANGTGARLDGPSASARGSTSSSSTKARTSVRQQHHGGRRSPTCGSRSLGDLSRGLYVEYRYGRGDGLSI